MSGHRSPSAILAPPPSLASALRFLGPGLILSAAVVGSGELIATTVLGAKTGFVLLWVILLSCFAKVAIQVQYGRHAITEGLPSFQAWDRAEGPRVWGRHWSVYAGLLFLLSAFIGAGGILAGAAQVLLYALPGPRVEIWAVAVAFVLGLLVYNGKYTQVERIATVFNCIFVAAILYCNLAVQRTPYAFGLAELMSGLRFRLPPEGLALAVAVFGITGIGAGEIVMYPYWCIEKGYSAWAGPSDGSPEWLARARGWIRVMQLDAIVSLAVYTVATCGFYCLGAAVLQPQGTIEDGPRLVLQISGIFTGVLGRGSQAVFMVCAFTVLFSTLFSNTAGFSRLWTDMLGVLRIVDTGDGRKRIRTIGILAWALPAVWCATCLLVHKPLYLVTFMGISNSLFLLLVAWRAMIFRYGCTDRRLAPSAAFDGALWLSMFAIAFVATRVSWSLIG
ncbi:MAG: Nramp family divalent metal transporter [Acidobacteria bacterium]|nr:Nramp family divalent metal transporter [Acidobacteriota bacterium]